MDDTKVKGIVLYSKDYKEKDKLVTIFTLEDGIICAVLKGVKNPNAKLKFAKEPFCFAEFILCKKNGFNTITSANSIDLFYDISKEITKYMAGTAILQIVNSVVNINQPETTLFIETLKALKILAYENIDVRLVLISFSLKVLTALGYKVVLNKCNSCQGLFFNKCFINLDTLEVVCTACKNYNNIPISTGVQSIYKLLGSCDFDKLTTMKFPSENIIQALNILQTLFEVRFSKKINFNINLL